MRLSPWIVSFALAGVAAAAGPAVAATYLNSSNITVAVGVGTSPGDFNNTFNNGATITKVIDAPSASAEEFHDQQTHIWYTADALGGGLELRFDFQIEYDISVLHFWNYTSENFDVDTVSFTFYSGANVQVGALSVEPELGTSPGIRAQNLTLAAPLNVRYVTAFLSGSNRQVDFQNIGFTADVSAPIPEPATFGLMALGSLAVLLAARRRSSSGRPEPYRPAGDSGASAAVANCRD
jgi:PEP-CTERM motif